MSILDVRCDIRCSGCWNPLECVVPTRFPWTIDVQPCLTCLNEAAEGATIVEVPEETPEPE